MVRMRMGEHQQVDLGDPRIVKAGVDRGRVRSCVDEYDAPGMTT